MTASGGRASATLRAIAPAALVLVISQVLWPLSAGTFVSGLILGGLTSLNALGMALIWRSNRVLNIAQGDLGTLPATLVLLMLEAWKLPFLFLAPVGVLAAVVCGVVIEMLFIRRFAQSSRLILMVVTLGISQLLTFAALMLPRAWGLIPAERTFPPPFGGQLTIGAVIFNANDLMAAVAVPVTLLALVVFLRSTDIGIAIRAAAERPDRASTLGVPVRRLGTIVWAIAAVLSFVSVFLTAGVTSLAPGYAVTLTVVLRSLAALVMGRMEHLVTITTSAIALGVLDAAIRSHHSDANLVAPLLAVIILIALLAQRQGRTRAEQDDAGAWRDSLEVRPVPEALARRWEVRLTRGVLVVGIAVVALGAPHVMGTGGSLKAGALLVFATIGVSLVLLSGWAGQVSLGQMTFVGIGGAIAAWGTVSRHLDPLISLLAAGIVGAIVAVIVGLPALRLRGLYLAVTTLALALAASSALFSNAYWNWIPLGTFHRPALFDRWSLDSATRVYYLALGVLVLALVAVRGIRRSRTGRVLVALRDNPSAAAAYGISVTRAKLTAFAMSGFIAAVAGATFVFHQASFRSESYQASESINVFVSAVIGGLTSLPGAVLGALFSKGTQWLLPGSWQVFALAGGVLFVLMVFPEGLGGLVFRVRDFFLRALAIRRGIAARSLTGNTLSRDDDDTDLEDAA